MGIGGVVRFDLPLPSPIPIEVIEREVIERKQAKDREIERWINLPY